MARRHGSSGLVEMDSAGGSSYVQVASLNSWTLDMSRERSDATAFGDTNKQYTQGLPDVKGTYGGWFDSADLAIFGVATGATPVSLRLKPSATLDALVLFSGLAYLDASINVSHSGTIAVSGSFVAGGDWILPS